MSTEAVLLVASAASVLSALVFRLAYRDYLKNHVEFVAAVRQMHEAGSVTAETVAALAPAPPLAVRTSWRGKAAA